MKLTIAQGILQPVLHDTLFLISIPLTALGGANDEAAGWQIGALLVWKPLERWQVGLVLIVG